MRGLGRFQGTHLRLAALLKRRWASLLMEEPQTCEQSHAGHTAAAGLPMNTATAASGEAGWSRRATWQDSATPRG